MYPKTPYGWYNKIVGPKYPVLKADRCAIPKRVTPLSSKESTPENIFERKIQEILAKKVK
jgi:hypothetical protein